MAKTRFRMHATLSKQTDTQRWMARTISPDDIPLLGELLYIAYRGTVDDNGESESDALQEVQDVFAGKYGPLLDTCSFLIEEKGQIQGASMITCWQEQPLVVELVIHPGVKNRGMGTYLLKKSMNALLEQGENDLYLYVMPGNVPAQYLYKKLGFRPIAENVT